MKYIVKNIKTGETFGPYVNKNRARNVRDKRDMAYGAVAHIVLDAPA